MYGEVEWSGGEEEEEEGGISARRLESRRLSTIQMPRRGGR